MPSSGPSPVDSGQPSGPTVAVAHYPEGAGHATRMLAVADELERRGAEVRMAGGGAGTRFVALNGYDEFEPATVDYIDTFQGGSMRQVLSESVPATARRVTDYIEWLRELAPDALVTDDMFAAMAALRVDTPLYVLKHDMPGLYRNRLERAGASFHTGFQATAARDFFYPAVWPADGLAPEDVTRVPPVALEGDDAPDGGADVVVVPSHYSELGRIATALEREGYDVIDVGSDDWEAVPSLLPHLRAADVVVCSGYSTVMDAAVAGTPCVVHPATDEQAAVADRLRETDGFAVAEKPLDVLEAVADPPGVPSHENGASAVAARVLDDLGRHETAADGSEGSRLAAARPSLPAFVPDRAAVALRTATDRGVAGAAALATGSRALALRGRTHLRTAGRRLARGAARVRARATRAARALVTAGRSAAASARRFAVAAVVLLASVAVFTRGRLGRTRESLGAALDGTATALRPVADRCRTAGAVAGRRVGDVATSLVDGLMRAGRRLGDTVATGENRE